MSLPVTAPIIGGAVEALTPGPTGTLTIAENTALRAAEQSTGTRLAAQQGLSLVESAHKGADFVAVGKNGAKTTWDAIGQPGAYKNWASTSKDFFAQLTRHINLKSADKVAVDLKGASKAQVSEIKNFVKGLTKEEQQRVTYVK
jgi:hypothetical protein